MKQNIEISNPYSFQDISCFCPPNLLWARLRYTSSEGIGQKKGYTSFDFFNGMMGTENGLIFTDLRGHIFDDGKWAFNAGLGIRYRFDQKKIIGGANFFFDYRRNFKNNFTQIGLGYEVLGRYLGFRMNGYIPFGATKKPKGIEFNRFEANRLIYDHKFKLAMYGVDADFFGRICRNKDLEILLGVTPYYFKGSFGKNAIGAKTRVEVEAFQTISGMIRASYDKVFKFNIQGEARLKFAFGPKVKSKKKSRNSAPLCYSCCDEYLINKRLVDPLDRQEIIVISDQEREEVAVDSNGIPLNFLFVNNLANRVGSGTAEDPYAALEIAQAESSVGDFIYVFTGVGGTVSYRNGFVFKDDQSLLSSGIEQTILTSDGVVIVPQFDEKKPTVTNQVLNENIIVLANNNVISGFRIIGLDTVNTVNGIIASGPTVGSTIINNDIIDAGEITGTQGSIFIDLTPGVAVEKTFVIQDNFITSSESGVDGIRVDCSGVGGDMSANFDIFNNNITGHASSGINIFRTSGTSDCVISGRINNNEVSSNSVDGIVTAASGGAEAFIFRNMEISNNFVAGNASEGITLINSQGTISVSDNISEGNGGGGGTGSIFLSATSGNTLNAEMLNNRASGNNILSGIQVQADSATINLTFINNIVINDEITFDVNGTGTINVFMSENEGILDSSGNVVLID